MRPAARIALLEAERQKDAARLTAYLAHMNLAQREWNDGNVSRVLDLLDVERPRESHADLREFEWFYLDRLCHSELLTLEGHARGVTAVAFTLDGHRIASASDDGKIKVWDASTGLELLTLRGHTGKVRHVAFNSDGRRIASASEDQTVKVWDAVSGHVVRTIEGHSAQVFGLAFSPDGHRIASASEDSTVKMWDANTGQELGRHAGHIGWVYRVAFSPDGRRIAAAGVFGRVEVWDAVSGRLILTLKGDPRFVGTTFSSDLIDRFDAPADVFTLVTARDILSGHQVLEINGSTYAEGRLAHSVAFSPDGRRIASDGWDHTVKVWNASSGQELLTLKGHTDSVSSVAFSPDGDRIASASLDRTLKLWDAKNSQEMFTLRGHTGKVRHVAFSPDGRRIASASDDRTVKVWDAVSGLEARTFKVHRTTVSTAAFSPDCRQLVGIEPLEGVRVWDIEKSKIIMALGSIFSTTCTSFSPDGRLHRLLFWLDGQGVSRRVRTGGSRAKGAHPRCPSRGFQSRWPPHRIG